MGIPFSFSWSADEDIFAIEIRHVEGGFASLQIDVRNPRVGLLSGNVWATLTYNGDSIFFGRLIGIPENLQDEVVRLQFTARPANYIAQKTALAEKLKVPPYWDPVWLQTNINDLDTVLEARSQLWHIDRVTLTTTVSDIVNGEDGTVDVGQDDHFYDGMTVSYGQTPLLEVDVTGTVSWDQTGSGSVDLTPLMIAAFQSSGSPLPSPLIGSLTGDGLLSSWPAPGTSIGGGWAMGGDSYAVSADDWIRPSYLTRVWTDVDPYPTPAGLPAPKVTPFPVGVSPSSWSFPIAWEFPLTYFSTFLPPPLPALPALPTLRPLSFAGLPVKVWAAAWQVHCLSVKFTVQATGKRSRSETVSFSLRADVQPIVTDPDGAEIEKVDLSSNAVTQGIDPGGAMPIPPSSPIYFQTTRGAQSFEYLIALARAKLLARSRCVIVKFITTWDFVIGWISCRYNVRLFDYRLPGGGVVGKITGYVLQYSDAGISAEVTIACTVGRGGSVASFPGSPSYVGNGYVTVGYQTFIGQQISLIPGQIVYQTLTDFPFVDDGVDFNNLTAPGVLLPVPAVNISMNANTVQGSTTLSGLGGTAGLEPGIEYEISGLFIPLGATVTYTGNGNGTLSVAATATFSGGPVTITGGGNNGVSVVNGMADQVNVIDRAIRQPMPDPAAALKNAATKVCLNLVSIDGGTFHTDFPHQDLTLKVPQTIDLEAS